ncbi:MAG: hypothetical protein H6622_14970 [Halobacteriovoraceae bacterium]|nr:hypothetical protein [Halobacteriovoraceae bacterium]
MSLLAEMTNGEGRFYAYEDDSLKFINQQLLSSAFQDVLDKEMKKMGLDSDLFWQKFEERLAENLNPISDRLQKKYGINPPESSEDKKADVDPAKKDAFDKEFRLIKLKMRAKLGNIRKAIKSYEIKKKSRATRSASSRFLILSALVDSKQVHEIYKYFTRSGQGLQFEKTYLTVNYEFQQTSWNELGVEKSDDFTSVLEQYWQQWLVDNFKEKLGEIIIADSSRKKMLQDYVFQMSTNAQLMTGESSAIGQDFQNNSWLNIQLKYRRIDDNEKKDERAFEISAKFLYLDLNNSEVILSADYPRVEKVFKFESDHKLSSLIASFSYQLPLQDLLKIRPTLAQIPMNSSRFILEVNGLTNIKDLIQVNDHLTNVGVILNLKSMIKTYSGSKGILAIQYTGKKEDLNKLLLKIDQSKLNTNMLMAFPNKENMGILILKYITENSTPVQTDLTKEKI